MPNLPPNSSVMVDNTSYHNKQSELAPTSNTKKTDMQKWLREKANGQKLCKKVKEIEDEYIKSYHVVDTVTDQFIIFVDDESDSDDDDDDDDDDDEDNETTEPTPGTSSATAGFNIMEGISIPRVDGDD
ncbi:hypothetical protein EVAR_43622_1 [Eumeta japonica]|uniref:Uncharacterized protein n=1 Tax=Eumeta variegata TaxID=151549 RepID=A0A4C1XGV5_EUMVA|nr:hypothetical protein EVAR_43622_1 [Eumeta japonica]